ncbi:MAG: ABC transporter ATP-binding protein [Oscillospiraceae bacterium]|nr:ABC transporter ATP-binding protein [Oscillospiraceae bacterium]MCL2277950.1 ABC transporter ATP-binding protein [Oscillospiraceae bacterium]
MPIIEVKDLSRDYVINEGVFKKKMKVIHAVKNISFSVEKGEVFGLLGQNGAGKTTTIKMLITMLAPTSGTCKVLGYDTFGQERMIRTRINFVFGGEYGLYRRLSARDNLKYFANLYKLPKGTRDNRIDELLKLVDLTDRADTRVETFSKGMTQRVQIARGLINNPEVLFMDEPTIGLDPVGAETLRKTIVDVNKLGTTVLLTTHNMYEADELCNRIAIIKEGEIITLDTPANIKKKLAKKTSFTIEVEGNSANIKDKMQSMEELSGVSITEKDVMTLEDAYLQLVKGSNEK